MKIKKLKDLKNWINKLSDGELEKGLFYVSDEYGLSGQVSKIDKAKTDYYIDDNDSLSTKSELTDSGYDKDDIERMTIEIPKGTYFISF